MKRLIYILKKIWFFIDSVNKHKAVSFYELEEKELRAIFATLLADSFNGVPTPPVYLSLRLLPYMEYDMKIMFERLDAIHDPIGELFSVYDIE